MLHLRRLLVRRIAAVLLLVAVATLIGCARATPTRIVPDLSTVNEANPGERIDLESHVVKGKQTLFEFYSVHCPPSQEMAVVMDRLAAGKGDLAVRKVNIDRAGQAEIDFHSPLAEQYGIDTIPWFKLYDASGRLQAEGKAAKDIVREWYQEVQQSQPREQDR